MKNFFKMLLAVVCGIFVAWIISLIILTGFVGALSDGSSTVIPSEGILDLNFSKVTITEQGGSNPDINLSSLSSISKDESVSLWNAVQAINKAAEDPGVKMIYLRADEYTASLANTEELRKALANFRESGKAIVAYTETPTTGNYWLASVSDKVLMSNVNGGSSMITGIGTQLIFLKDILDKFGVNVQLIRHGKYKSAGEMFIKNAPSKENLEQNQVMINSIWNVIASDIENSRSIEAGSLSRMIDNLELNNPQDFLNANLVDELVSREDLQNKLATLSFVDDWKKVKLIPFNDYVKAKVQPNVKAKQKIAVIYAEGEIAEGKTGQGVLGDKYASIIAKVRQDESIKAIVLRVSSPGGSVTASDKIRTEIELLRKEKPVIASYGSYAASGGYWISNSCDKIFTDGTTLTGSIGVFSMIPDFSKTVKDFAHVGIYTVGSSKHSDMYSGIRPLSTDELAYMQRSVEDIYETFVNIVAEGRELDPDFVDSIAQGRVWTGSDALGIHLVDEIGTLEDAVKFAAIAGGEAELTKWNIEAYPKAPSQFDAILQMLNMDETDVLANTSFAGIADAYNSWNFATSERMFARLPFEYVIK